MRVSTRFHHPRLSHLERRDTPSGGLGFVQRIGTAGGVDSRSIARDATDNTYLAGSVEGAVDFGAGGGESSSVGSHDVFLMKTNPAGEVQWVRTFGGGGEDKANDVTADAAGNTYVTGWFSGTADFDPGLGEFKLTSFGKRDAFVSKYDANGNFLWARQFGGGTYDDYGGGVALDGSGNVFVSGWFTGTADFNPGTAVNNLTSASTTGSDAFLVKLDAAGEYEWANRWGGSSSDYAESVTADAAGHVYAVGRFAGTVDFDPGNGTDTKLSAGSDDGFILKLDGDGKYAWSIAFGDSGSDIAYAAAVAPGGDVVVGGRFQGTVNFNPTGIDVAFSNGNYDGFLARYTAAGAFVWVKSVGGLNDDYVYGMDVGPSGVVATGRFRGAPDFDPGPGQAVLTTVGPDNLHDVFVWKLTLDGELDWVRGFGGPVGDVGNEVVLTAVGNVVSTGAFSTGVDFDPGPGTDFVTNYWLTGVFAHRLANNGDYLGVAASLSGSKLSAIRAVTDAAGNTYAAGHFQGAADFDPGPGRAWLTGAGMDIFLAKYDKTGALSWVKSIGGPADDYAYNVDLAVDAGGSIYLTGAFLGTADFDPSPGEVTLTSAGSSDSFVAKYDADGKLSWARRMGGADAEGSYAIAVGPDGSVTTVGQLWGAGDYDPGSGTVTLTPAGLIDVYVSRLDSAGNYVWAKRIGGTSLDYAGQVAVDSAGDVVVTGRITGTVDIDPGSKTVNVTSAGFTDVFLVKLSAAGEYQWGTLFGGTSDDLAGGLAVDAAGNVHAAVNFIGTADFNPGGGTANLTSAGNYDVGLVKLTGGGAYTWAKRLGGTTRDTANGLLLDGGGNVHSVGTFTGTADFDPGSGAANLVASTSSEVFVSKLTAAGNYDWASQFGGTLADTANGLSIDAAGNLYTSGTYTDAADFDPTPDVYNLYGGGYFLLKVRQTNGAAPVAGDNAYATPVNTQLTVAAVGVLANDSDADGDPLRAYLATPPTQGTVTLNPDGSFVYTPPAGFTGVATFTYRASDGLDAATATVTITVGSGPAEVSAVVVNDGAVQRSRVTTLAVTFDMVVTLPANAAEAFELKRQSDGQVVALNASVSGNTVTLTFTGGPVEFGSLADGRYTLTALASKINSGNFDGNGDGTAGDNYELVGTPASAPKLFRLFGDADGSGAVDFGDFLAFRAAFGGGASAVFDFEGDGDVDFNDFLQFRARFGTGV